MKVNRKQQEETACRKNMSNIFFLRDMFINNLIFETHLGNKKFKLQADFHTSLLKQNLSVLIKNINI